MRSTSTSMFSRPQARTSCGPASSGMSPVSSHASRRMSQAMVSPTSMSSASCRKASVESSVPWPCLSETMQHSPSSENSWMVRVTRT